MRQAYRDLRRGYESVAAILWQNCVPSAAPENERSLSDISSVQSEIARLQTVNNPVDVLALIANARRAVDSLANRHGVVFQIAETAENVTILTNVAAAQQLLVRLLSHAIQQNETCIKKLPYCKKDMGMGSLYPQGLWEPIR